MLMTTGFTWNGLFVAVKQRAGGLIGPGEGVFKCTGQGQEAQHRGRERAVRGSVSAKTRNTVPGGRAVASGSSGRDMGQPVEGRGAGAGIDVS